MLRTVGLYGNKYCNRFASFLHTQSFQKTKNWRGFMRLSYTRAMWHNIVTGYRFYHRGFFDCVKISTHGRFRFLCTQFPNKIATKTPLVVPKAHSDLETSDKDNSCVSTFVRQGLRLFWRVVPVGDRTLNNRLQTVT